MDIYQSKQFSRCVYLSKHINHLVYLSKQTGAWKETKIESLLNDLSPIPDHKTMYGKEKIGRISI